MFLASCICTGSVGGDTTVDFAMMVDMWVVGGDVVGDVAAMCGVNLSVICCGVGDGGGCGLQCWCYGVLMLAVLVCVLVSQMALA